MNKGVIITATDTGAGKTYVSSLLISALRSLGVDAVGYKPVACGDRDDARAIQKASEDSVSLDEINPIYYKNSTSPYTASLLENQPIDFGVMEAGLNHLKKTHDFVVVEGVGGWEVPMSKEVMFGDFAAKLDLPVLLVVENKLGCINHALLTIKAIRGAGVSLAGIIFNTQADEWDTPLITNKAILEEISGVPILAELIHEQDFLEIDEIREALGLV